MIIRKAEIADASEIRKLVLSLAHFFLEDVNDSIPLWFLESLEVSAFESRFSDEKFTNFVYLEEPAIKAYISIKNGSHVYHLFVSEEFQGKGIAKKLWNHAKSQLPASAYEVRSSIFAIPVYQSFGFTITEPASSKDGIRFQTMKKSK